MLAWMQEWWKEGERKKERKRGTSQDNERVLGWMTELGGR